MCCSSRRSALAGLLASFYLFLIGIAHAQAPTPIYLDHLDSGFQDWGWATRSYTNTAPVHSGSMSIAVTLDSGYAGLQIWHSDLSSSNFTGITFWINGGTNGGQKLQVYGLEHIGSNNNQGTGKFYALGTLQTNWQQFTVPLSSIGVANTNNFTGFVIQDRLGTTQPTFFVDDIQLDATPAPALNHLAVNATQSVRTVDPRWFGVNTAIWDGNFDSSTTISLLREMGNRALRGPGGSLSDEYHWVLNKTSPTNNWTWNTSFGNFLHVATNVGAQTFITVNYGSGSSNEAAAWVAYANGYSTNSQSLGVDQYGTNWLTVGYWASLRSATRLGTDDGRNFLRIGRSAPLGFNYWEMGNECYGTWETDYNTNSPYKPNDGWTYANRVAGYAQMMKLVDPTIKVGIVVAPGEDSYVNGNTTHPALNPRTGQTHYGWTPVLLATLKTLGVTPDFAIHHVYPEWTDPNNPSNSNDNDRTLLLQSSTNWPGDAANLRQQITDYLGAPGTGVELVCTENNSDAGASGRQSTSLVNGLYYACSFAQLAQTEFNSLIWWDLRNGTDTGGFFGETIYGWRTYGDLGMINGLATRHPTFYAAKMMQFFAQPGDTILPASSDYPLLSAYAARRASGAVSVLVLNKDAVSAFNAQVAVSGFVPGPTALLRTYGILQDEAARTNGPVAAQDIATNSFTGAAGAFNYTAPALSLSLFTLSPTPPSLAVLSGGQPGGQITLQVLGQPNVRYVLQSSANLSAWTSVATNTLSTATWNFTNTIASGPSQQFWRAAWMP